MSTFVSIEMNNERVALSFDKQHLKGHVGTTTVLLYFLKLTKFYDKFHILKKLTKPISSRLNQLDVAVIVDTLLPFLDMYFFKRKHQLK